jgi:hypothetical protein
MKFFPSDVIDLGKIVTTVLSGDRLDFHMLQRRKSWNVCARMATKFDATMTSFGRRAVMQMPRPISTKPSQGVAVVEKQGSDDERQGAQSSRAVELPKPHKTFFSAEVSDEEIADIIRENRDKRALE